MHGFEPATSGFDALTVVPQRHTMHAGDGQTDGGQCLMCPPWGGAHKDVHNKSDKLPESP